MSALSPVEAPSATNILEGHPLWSFGNAIFTIILIVVIVMSLMYGIAAFSNIQEVKKDWANQRCSPMIMPFASLFGYDAKENFEFCMGKIFSSHSSPILGSIGAIFSQFTSLLQSIFNSVNSIRNIIASLGGGINVIFQEFTDRITNFFFQLRLSAIRLKTLFGRMYASLFSVMYMGLSGITGMSNFTNTYLFGFLDTFCFPEDTQLLALKGTTYYSIPIKDVKIGDVLLPGLTRVTATFQFYSKGQPMVRIGDVVVSTNHYIRHEGRLIMAGNHPHAIPMGPWKSNKPLYCLNTENHTIPVGYLTFMDYDETSEGDAATLQFIEKRLNGRANQGKYDYKDACFAIQENARIKLEKGVCEAKDVKIGDRLSTGGEVVGLIRREVTEVCQLPNGIEITPATLHWDPAVERWKRYGEHKTYHTVAPKVFVSLVVVPHSQIELEDGTRVRDYMELCSPDAEMHYSTIMESL